MAKRYGQRPASFIFAGDISGDLLAYQFDKAVYLFGKRTEIRFEETDKKGKRVRTLAEAMDPDAVTGDIGEMNISDEEKVMFVRMMLGG